MKRLVFSASQTDTLTDILDLIYILRDFEEQIDNPDCLEGNHKSVLMWQCCHLR